MPIVVARFGPSKVPSGPTVLALVMAVRTASAREPHRRQPRRIDPDPQRRLLGAGDAHLGDALHLRQPLRDHAVGGVIDLAGRHGLRGQRQDQDRRSGGVGLAESGERRHVARQVAQRRVERGLHVARRGLDVAAQVELHGDARDPQRAD